MTEEQLPEEVTKHSFREDVWNHLMANELVNFPLCVYNRIPNFKGAAQAAQRLVKLEEFKKAEIIKINLDKPQEPVRYLALEAGKEILVPIPRLKSDLFLHVKGDATASKNELRTLSTIQGLQKAGKPVGIDSDIKIDLVILGSVCVSRDGHRLGNGIGYADLQFAVMMKMGAITQDTIVVTTVHDCQVSDSLPSHLFKEHDVPVDVIVTPTQTIVVETKLKKPTDIIWHMLSKRRLKTMEVLQQLRERDEKDGKLVTLKEVDSDPETQERSDCIKNSRRLESRRYASRSKNNGEEGEKDKLIKPRFRRNRPYRKLKSEGENVSPSAETEEKAETNSEKNTRPRRKNLRKKSKSQIEFSLKLSNISSGARVRDLKNALLERGVKPSEIVWMGYRGICYLHFSKLRSENTSAEQPVQVDSIMANLQELRIGETDDKKNDFIIVEPAKPISRIEVTDVSSV